MPPAHGLDSPLISPPQLCPTAEAATVLAPMALAAMALFAGFMITEPDMRGLGRSLIETRTSPPSLHQRSPTLQKRRAKLTPAIGIGIGRPWFWMYYGSWMTYPLESLLANEVQGRTFVCGQNEWPLCAVSSGDDLMRMFAYSYDNKVRARTKLNSKC
eukprot:tig00000361_g24410.t1